VSLWQKIVGRRPLSDKDQSLSHAVTQIVGRKPKNLDLFKLATLHSSVAKTSREGYRESNERLEYLGDAVLSMVVAEYLFKKFPFQPEGFLTEIRSRIVKRDTLNNLAHKLGIHHIVESQERPHAGNSKSIYGNALEAIIGAVFLDRGYSFCRIFILEKIVTEHLDLEHIIQTNTNYKSRIIEWAQKENKEVIFESSSVETTPPYTEFTVSLKIDNVKTATGKGTTKKKAEQDAALKACEVLKLP